MTAWTTDDGRDMRDELAMDKLRAEPWAKRIRRGLRRGAYRAIHLSGGALLTAGTPGGLAMAIRADIARRTARTGQ